MALTRVGGVVVVVVVNRPILKKCEELWRSEGSETVSGRTQMISRLQAPGTSGPSWRKLWPEQGVAGERC